MVIVRDRNGNARVARDIRVFLPVVRDEAVDDQAIIGVADTVACGQPSGRLVAIVMIRCSSSKSIIWRLNWRFMLVPSRFVSLIGSI